MSRFPAPLDLLASAQKSIRRDARFTSPCIAMPLLLPLFAWWSSRESRISRRGRRQQHLCLLTNRCGTLCKDSRALTHRKKVRFVCWTHRQNMPTTRPTIAVNFFTIFIGTCAVCAENTKLQPLTRGIPNVEPDMALSPWTRTNKTARMVLLSCNQHDVDVTAGLQVSLQVGSPESGTTIRTRDHSPRLSPFRDPEVRDWAKDIDGQCHGQGATHTQCIQCNVHSPRAGSVAHQTPVSSHESDVPDPILLSGLP